MDAPVLQCVRGLRILRAELADVVDFVFGWDLAAFPVVVDVGFGVIFVGVGGRIGVIFDVFERVDIVWFASELYAERGWMAFPIASLAMMERQSTLRPL